MVQSSLIGYKFSLGECSSVDKSMEDGTAYVDSSYEFEDFQN